MNRRRLVVPFVLLAVSALAIGILGWRAGVFDKDEQKLIAVDGAFPVQSYRFEATVTKPKEPDAQTYGVIRGWYQAPNKTRWEIGCAGHPMCKDYVRILIVTEDSLWFYEPETNVYAHETISVADLTGWPFPLLSNFQPGPLTQPLAAKIGKEIVSTGRERLLDVDVGVYGEPGFRLWIDEAHAFTLKQTGSTTAAFEVLVTKVDYNLLLDAELFRFQPPPGARENTGAQGPGSSVGSSTTFGTSDLNIPPGFLVPSYIPTGYVLRNAGSTESAGRISQIQRTFGPRGSSAEVEMRQQFRVGGPLAPLMGTPVTVGGSSGVRSTTGDTNMISWTKGDVTVTLSSSDLPFEELVRIAESMR